MSSRPICPTCNARPVAINCHSDEKVYYRKQCDACLRIGKKLKAKPPAWAQSGYKKKDRCEMCNFKAKLPTKQLFVYHVDGNLKNTNSFNLKTICANCQCELAGGKMPWKPAPIVPDF
jgi:hypothetical protein